MGSISPCRLANVPRSVTLCLCCVSAWCVRSSACVDHSRRGSRCDICADNCCASLLIDMASRKATEDIKLLQEVMAGSMRRVKAALAAGANVDGSPELPCTPIMAAIASESIDMLNFLIERGADPDKPAEFDIPSNTPFVQGNRTAVMSGEMPLHLAAREGNVEIVRSLLKRARANPNTIDKSHRTPLATACAAQHSHVAAIVPLLLEAGADPNLTDVVGFTPMHMAARFDHLDVVDMLHTRAPATVGSVAKDGTTPLLLACSLGHEAMVSLLISLGAVHEMIPGECCPLPAAAAAVQGSVGVIRLLIKAGMKAIGHPGMLPHVLCAAACCHHAKVLQLLLAAEGAEMRSLWANSGMEGKQMLHYGAAHCSPAVVSVLLEAGADEAKRDAWGVFPRDVIGVDLEPEQLPMDRGKEIAILRMLEQGPAYRARSWAWPTDEASADGCGDDVGAVRSVAPSFPELPVGMRIFRPKSDRTFFPRVVGRYSEKE